MSGSTPPSYLASAVCYQDAKAALAWLEAAFGFEPVMVILGADDSLMHSQMRFGDSLIMIGNEWSPQHRSPRSLGGFNTQTVHVHLASDLDGHCARARAAGATILAEPETQVYGDRTYRCTDPEGHIWTFAQTVEALTPEVWDKAMGSTTRDRL